MWVLSFFLRYVVVSGYDLYPKSADSAYNTPSEYRTKLLKQIRKTQSVLGFGNTGTKDCKVRYTAAFFKVLPAQLYLYSFTWYILITCSSFYVHKAHACRSSNLTCFLSSCVTV